MSNTLMSCIHIYCIAFALMLRIPENLAFERLSEDVWPNSIEPESMLNIVSGNSDEINWRDRSTSNLVKRVPNGFTGVRGKKNVLLEEKDTSQDFDDLKRLKNYELQYIFDILRNDDYINRAPRNTVKKTYSNGMYEEDMEKRGLKNAFLGVRGKKKSDHLFYKRATFNDQSTEKKIFSDFTNKFVAVRGKKSINDNDYGSFKSFSRVKDKKDIEKGDTLQFKEELQ